MIRGPDEIREAYRDERVAEEYVDLRFKEPLGALLHARQAGVLRRAIRESRPRRALEIACGPARLTVEAAPALSGCLAICEASAQMIAVARRRLEGLGGARPCFVQGDGFKLPFRSEFDLVYTFRFIRHFELADRERLYAEIARVLRPGGLLVLDAVNEAVSGPLRAAAPPGEYKHYDALLRPETLRAEVATAGFEVISLQPVQRQFGALSRLQVLVAPRSRAIARAVMEVVDRLGGGEPLEWVATCRRA